MNPQLFPFHQAPYGTSFSTPKTFNTPNIYPQPYFNVPFQQTTHNSTGDPWLDQFIASLDPPKQHMQEEQWKPVVVKRELRELDSDLKSLQSLLELIEGSQHREDLISKANELKTKISKKLKKFEGEAFQDFKAKINKRRRNQRRKKRLKLLKSLTTISDPQELETRFHEKNRQIDDWIALRNAHDFAAQKQIEEGKELQRKLAERRLLQKKISSQKELLSSLLKLGELRNFKPENLSEIQQILQQDEIQLEPLHKTFNTKYKYKQKEENLTEKDVLAFYNRGNTDTLSLIEIRNAWDMYIVSPTEQGSSRIPKEFIECPKKPGKGWEMFLNVTNFSK